jgi:acyl dehydratase
LPKLVESSLEVRQSRMGVNYGLNKVRFTAPVPVGSRVRARVTLLAADPVDHGGYQLTWSIVIELDGSGKPACVAESVNRRYP